MSETRFQLTREEYLDLRSYLSNNLTSLKDEAALPFLSHIENKIHERSEKYNEICPDAIENLVEISSLLNEIEEEIEKKVKNAIQTKQASVDNMAIIRQELRPKLEKSNELLSAFRVKYDRLTTIIEEGDFIRNDLTLVSGFDIHGRHILPMRALSEKAGKECEKVYTKLDKSDADLNILNNRFKDQHQKLINLFKQYDNEINPEPAPTQAKPKPIVEAVIPEPIASPEPPKAASSFSGITHKTSSAKLFSESAKKADQNKNKKEKPSKPSNRKGGPGSCTIL